MDRKSETFDTKAQLARQLTHFKKLLFPSSCNLCREPLAAGQPSFCSNCVDQLPYLDQQCIRCAQPLIYSSICPNCQKNPPNFRRCVALFDYQPPICASIMCIKRNPHAPELKQLSLLLADLLNTAYKDTTLPSIVIPMPLHPIKLARRGFNQSYLIARFIKSKLSNLEILDNRCIRTYYGKPQHSKTQKQRWRSMSGAFTMQGDSTINNQNVALIDDVVTTGATATAATESLLKAGVKSVDLWCIARTGWHNDSS